MSSPGNAVRIATSQQASHGVPRLHIITDTRRGRDPLPEVRAALAASAAAGTPIALQVRAKDVTDLELLDLTRRVLTLARPVAAMVMVDDRVDIAIIAGAHGVHLGADDVPVEDAVRWAGPGLAVGRTARDPGAAQSAQQAGAAYLGVGPVFATTTKNGLPDPLGLRGLRAVAESSTLPVVAIGGVSAGAVPALLEAGAHGAAVVTAISRAADPLAATASLLRTLETAA